MSQRKLTRGEEREQRIQVDNSRARSHEKLESEFPPPSLQLFPNHPRRSRHLKSSSQGSRIAQTLPRVHCRTESEKREREKQYYCRYSSKVVEVQSGGGLHFTSLRTCRSIRDVLRLTAAAAVLAAAGVSGTRRHEGSTGGKERKAREHNTQPIKTHYTSSKHHLICSSSSLLTSCLACQLSSTQL